MVLRGSLDYTRYKGLVCEQSQCTRVDAMLDLRGKNVEAVPQHNKQSNPKDTQGSLEMTVGG